MRDLSILNRQLHTFRTDELQELRRVSDTIFEPLMRPFRQKRSVQEFSFKKSIRAAQKIGAFMPSYEKVKREHRKSRLIIAMSLAGIDRCSAVSLIPLFSCLKETSLDFNFYIYTDDLVKAEFTYDGFLSNDYQIAWNHVSGPTVMQRLVDMEIQDQEDILLLIDSLGGGDSSWHEYRSYQDGVEVREEQKRYLSAAGKFAFYSRIRKELNGDYSRISNVKLPKEWTDRVISNTKQRWMDTPALEQYMIRWVFNPRFGEVKHSQSYIPYQSAFSIMQKLRGKFKQIHLLTPNNHNSNRLKQMIATNVIDYHHKANTIYGFAHVLSNIVHGSCPFDGPFTKKVSYEIVKFSEYKGMEEESVVDGGEGEGDHTNLVATGKCFDNCPNIMPNLPSVTSVKLDKRVRGSNAIEINQLPFNEIDLSDLLPVDMNLVDFWKEKILPLDFEIEKGDSQYTRLRKAEEVLDTVKSYHIIYKKGFGYNGLVKEKRPLSIEATKLGEILKGVEYDKHNTRSLQNFVEEFFLTVSPCYHAYLSELSLKHVIWCHRSVYDQSKRAISINPKQTIEQRKNDVWHELGHHLESSCPPINAFSNELLKQKGGAFNRKKLVQVGGGGEWAMPVTNGTADWIKPYAGKWYKRSHQELPNPTEIISVHCEYFTEVKRLSVLIDHDPHMVRFMAFVLMGGPVAAIESLRELKRREVLNQIHQRDTKSSGYSLGRGGRGSRGGGFKDKKNKGYGF